VQETENLVKGCNICDGGDRLRQSADPTRKQISPSAEKPVNASDYDPPHPSPPLQPSLSVHPNTHACAQVARHIRESTPAAATNCSGCSCIGRGGLAPLSHMETMAQLERWTAHAGLGSSVGVDGAAAGGAVGRTRTPSGPACGVNRPPMPAVVESGHNLPSQAAVAAGPTRLPPLAVTAAFTRRRRRVGPAPANADSEAGGAGGGERGRPDAAGLCQ
jgi:hypothetical protein